MSEDEGRRANEGRESPGQPPHLRRPSALFVMPTAEQSRRIQRVVADLQVSLGTAMSAETLSRMQEIAAYLDRTMSAPYRAIEEWQRSNRPILEMATRPLGHLLDSEGRIAGFLGRVNHSFSDFVRPSQTLMANAAAIAEALARLDEVSRNAIAASAFRPQLEFSALCSRILAEAGEDEGSSAGELRVAQTVHTAGAEVSAVSEVVLEGIASPFQDVPEPSQRPPTMGTYNLFERIDSTVTEVLGVGSQSSDLRRALVPITAVPREARIACHLIYKINSLPARPGGQPVFKRTTSLSEVENSLMCLFADDQALFTEFLTHMYKLIHEAPGADTNKLAAILNDEAEFRVVQDIKHIRTYLQHLIGDGRESQKVRQKAWDAFNRLIGKNEPATREDYRRSQLALLKRANRMLARALEVLQSA